MSTLDTLDSEYRALTEGCGLVDRAGRGRLALTGTERREFLHGQITQDIEGLEPGSTLAAGDGGVTAEVVELPFAARA